MSDVSKQTIEQKLKDTWRRDRRFCHVRGLSRLVIWLVTLMLVDFAIDWGILSRTGASSKLAMFLPVINAVVLFWVLWHEWLRHLRRYRPLLVALEVEKRNPELGSLLVSYTQLEGGAVDDRNVSRDLIEAMRNQAVTRSRPIDFREIIDFGQLKKLLAVAASIMLFSGILSFAWRDHVRTLFQRLAGAEIEYPTQTTVMELTGDFVVRTGGSATIEAAVDENKVVPAGGKVFTRLADGDAEWKALPLTKEGASARYSRDLVDLNRDLLYYVEIGDDRGETHRVRVIHSPQVVATEVRLQYPEYTGRGVGKSDQLNLEVPEGTEVSWQVRCAPAVKKVIVLASGKFAEVPSENEDDAEGDDSLPGVTTKEVEAKVAADGMSFEFSLPADDEIKYSFHWMERGSGKDFEFDDVQHTLRVIPDRPPDIELVEPVASGVGTVEKKLKIRARASDDYGLAKAWLVFSLDGSDEERLEIYDFLGAPAKEFEFTWDVKKSLPTLEPQRQVHYSVELVDLHPNSVAHTRRSAGRQLSILDQEGYLRWYREQLAAQHDQIRRAREAETASSRNVKELRVQEGEVR